MPIFLNFLRKARECRRQNTGKKTTETDMSDSAIDGKNKELKKQNWK